MAVAVAVLFFLLASPAVYAVDHIVGGSGGWGLSGGYDSWAAGQSFNVGDKLVFNYGGSHGVAEVSQDDYNNCATGNAITSFSNSPSTITLSKAGPMYFVCPSPGHCGSGMKLAITVQAAGSPGGSGSGSGSDNPPSSSVNPPSGTDNPPSGIDNPPTTPSTTGSIFPPTTATPATRNPITLPNGATCSFGSINPLMLGFSLVFAALSVV